MHVLTQGVSTQTFYPLADGRSTIGRSTENAIVLQDSLVSRHHAEIEVDAGQLTLRDVGGKNPIRVNGEELDGPCTLGDGDQISIGQTELRVELEAPEATSPLKLVRDGDKGFEPGDSGISLDAATVVFGRIHPPGAPAESLRRYDRLGRLYSLSAELLSVADEEELYDLVLTTATDAVGAQRGFLGLSTVDAESGEPSLEVVRFWDPEAGDKARSLEMSESILDHIQREQRAVVVRDVPETGDFGASVIDLNIRSFICAPILHRHRSLGVVYVDTRGATEQFDREDLEFISALGRMAGMGLGNLRSHHDLQRENEKLRSMVGGGGQIIGSSDAIKHVLKLVEKVAPRNASVLICGENGTGKELIAQAIHQASTRRDQPFVAVNCAALPPNLVESELFGHEKGAFTGATRQTEGKFDMADGGTLFLDEIGDMPLDMQVKILRALQERSYYRVGGKEEVTVDIRVIAATNTDLKRAIEEGSFREDLYFRLAVVTIEMPPLRDRSDDVFEIAEHLLNQGGSPIKLTKPTQECMRNYHWPGNVRELRNVLEQAVILGDGKRIVPSDLPPQVGRMGRGKMVFRLKPLSEVERGYIERVLGETGGNKAKAASILGISRETLYQKLRAYQRDDASSAGAPGPR